MTYANQFSWVTKQLSYLRLDMPLGSPAAGATCLRPGWPGSLWTGSTGGAELLTAPDPHCPPHQARGRKPQTHCLHKSRVD